MKLNLFTSPPAVGTEVDVIMYYGRWDSPRIVNRSTVIAVRDHKPVDCAPETRALCDLADGTREFWHNLQPATKHRFNKLK